MEYRRRDWPRVARRALDLFRLAGDADVGAKKPSIAPTGTGATPIRVHKGRAPSIEPAKVRELLSNGLTPAAIAEQLGVGRTSVYRALAR
jgi:DNA invertase Pin-like site-specific DNA recombinase